MKRKRRYPGDRGRGGLRLALALFLLTVAGCAGTSGDKGGAGADAARNLSQPESRPERQSYALGMVLGNQFRNRSVAVDPEYYLQGLKDALAGGKTLLTESEAQTEVNRLQRELQRTAVTAQQIPTGIEVSFKLDPRLTRGMYMGDRWVSPPTFTTTVQEGTEISIEARAYGVNANGKSIQVTPEWLPEDPAMVSVLPTRGNQVRILVQRAGQSTLRVVGEGISKELLIEATQKNDSLQVKITQ